MESIQRNYKLIAVVALVSAVVVAVVAYLLTDIAQKKHEATTPYASIVQITDETEDPATWGINFPHQFASYSKTVDQVRTRYGGSEALPQTPTKADPRSIVAQSRLEEDPRLKIMWAGYAFSEDFREERGHAHMLVDQEFTRRQGFSKQPGACINCHASSYVAMKKAGNGDLTAGFHALNALPYADARKHVTHPVSCIDCHTPQTMKLRVTRPAFVEGLRKLKATEGVANFDVNTMATPQQMRTFVCAQCHVEYYFKGDAKTLTFPWHNGLKADQILSYYDAEKVKDWTHAMTGAPTLKAQHPEFETWSQGIHARSGVSCTDCHMPFERVGAMKITDHHVRSPMLNVGRACQTCHRWPEEELRQRVETIQGRTFEMRGVALDALVEFVKELDGSARSLSEKQLAEARDQQRRAQFFLDFVEAENSMGFHAPEESLRLLGLSIDATRKGQNTLRSKESPRK